MNSTRPTRLRALARFGLIAGWLALLALVSLLALLARGVRRVARLALLAVAALALLAILQRCPPPGDAPTPPPRIATFNIRNLGAEPTDLARAAAVLAALDADVTAVQEIHAPAALAALAAHLTAATGHPHAAVASRCSGRSGLHVGFVYAPARAALLETREYPELAEPGQGRCDEGDRPALLARFAPPTAPAEPYEVIAVHFVAGGAHDKAERRRAQWDAALALVARRRAAGARRVALVGDANSTGYLDGRHGERDFIETRVRAAGLRLATATTGCSAYSRPVPARLAPSLLDHVVLTPELLPGAAAAVRGYCEALACRAVDADPPPRDYVTVSDHCPVLVAPR